MTLVNVYSSQAEKKTLYIRECTAHHKKLYFKRKSLILDNLTRAHNHRENTEHFDFILPFREMPSRKCCEEIITIVFNFICTSPT
ncbi:unnamed protein product [Allacma fusca]|uniref:Uncharacterized protein n=1 Tax=Allacma fusca TaxID=39272 RepID=A0A8J2LAS9_9HEXA|nr:unnamed protein product [Allacma fusca]